MMKKIFMAGLVSLGLLASCSTDDDATTGGGSTGNAYLQVQLEIANSQGASGTRANVDTNVGEESEYAVSNVTIVLANENNIAQHVYRNIGIESGTYGTQDTYTKTVASQVVAVQEGDYKVYVLANYDQSTMSPIVENSTDMSTTVFSTQVAYTGTTCKLAENNKFLMTNVELPSAVTTLKNDREATGKEVDNDWKDKSGGQENINLVSVTIERAVAKVTCNEQKTTVFTIKNGEGDDAETVATATLVGVDLINLNSQMYMIKKELAYADGITKQFDDLYYAKDPNFETTWDNTWTAATSPFYHPEGSDFKGFTGTDAPKFYCLENTMDKDQQQNGLTTGLLYQVEYVPADGKYTELSSAQSATDAYSQMFKQVLALADKDATISATMFDKEASSTDKTFYVYNELIFATLNGAKMYKAIAETSGGAAAVNTAYQGYGETVEGIKTYSDGICYYPVWIRHNTYANAIYMEWGKYGVVRNHWYDVTVDNITKLGYSKPTYGETPDPQNPDDKSNTWLQVKISIKPWRYISQHVDL